MVELDSGSILYCAVYYDAYNERNGWGFCLFFQSASINGANKRDCLLFLEAH